MYIFNWAKRKVERSILDSLFLLPKHFYTSWFNFIYYIEHGLKTCRIFFKKINRFWKDYIESTSSWKVLYEAPCKFHKQPHLLYQYLYSNLCRIENYTVVQSVIPHKETILIFRVLFFSNENYTAETLSYNPYLLGYSIHF